MTTTDLDQDLLDRCLAGGSQAWEDFVDRFLGLVLHVIDHTAAVRAGQLTPNQRDTLCEEVFAAIHHNDFRLLRAYQRRSNLATYLTVTVRRIVVRQMINGGYLGTMKAASTGIPAEPHRWVA